jgi:putative iron-regulated protein
MTFVFNLIAPAAAVMAGLLALGCGGDDEPTFEEKATPVVEGYTSIVRASYAESLAKAKVLKTAVDAFVAAPSADTLQAAKTAWLAARDPYGQTESYRFYDGPIDNPDDGPEGQINAWPLDEVYIDYVDGMADAGMINNAAMFPDITKDLIASQNENGGEKNISSGYHAVEFLLWGQDLSATGPGARPHTDYLAGAANFERRGQYLKLAAELLVDDLTWVESEWSAGSPYVADFQANPKEAVRRMLQGMGSLSGAELSGERMTVALDNADQEDEHSCFSDNTHRDLANNALAVQNVYLGRFGSVDGKGIDELVKELDPALDTKLKGQFDASNAAIAAITPPFDQAILNDKPKVLAAVRALQDETETIVEVATLLGITINLE